MVLNYKCKNCGADMSFDSTSGQLQCTSCGRLDDIEAMAGQNVPKDATHTYSRDNEDIASEHDYYDNDYYDNTDQDEPTSNTTFSGHEAVEYQCNNCGAAIITDQQTTAISCSFCGAGVVLSDRLAGSYAPSKVIPFTISKEQAQDMFKKWCKKGRFTPNTFMNADRIKNIAGIYVPFWLFDINGRGEVEATCTKRRSYTSGDWIYTETKYYYVYRKIDLNYLRIPCDASDKMDDKMMDKLEPYNYGNLKDFNMPYLAGYLAEKYDSDDSALLPRMKQRVNSYVDNYIANTIHGYSSVRYNRKDINIRQKNADYTLLPVWMVCYDYKDSEHNFAMNGQTGKVVGKPPISMYKVATWFLGLSGISFGLMRLFSLIAGGN